MVRDFCGHGVGRIFHALPNIVHYGKPGHGIGLKPGMFFTVEPMINLGGYGVKVLNDGWTAVTRDRSLSAQFEHSVGVTEDGVEIFTPLAQGLGQAPPTPESSGLADMGRLFAAGCGARRRAAAPARPSRKAARPFPGGRCRRTARLRADGAGAVRGDPAARRQAAGQGADRALRQLRRRHRGAAGAAAGGGWDRRGRRCATQDHRGRGAAPGAGQGAEQARLEFLAGAARLLHRGDGAQRPGGVPRPVPGPQERADRRRGADARHHRPHPRSIRARSSSGRWSWAPRPSSWCTTIRAAIRPPAAPISI